MAHFVLNSKVTIGNYEFSGVHEVRVSTGLHGLVNVCRIKVPSRARIEGGVGIGADADGFVTTGNMFNPGDAVKVELGYDGELQTEFEGFVKRTDLGKPLEIECEGYERELRLLVNMNRYYKTTTAKQLLTDMCSQTAISVVCPVDFPLQGIRLVDADGIDVINHIRKCSEGALTIFFIAPSTLWCGFVYTPYLDGEAVLDLPKVAYDLGYNCIQDNSLKERVPKERVQVFMNGTMVNGDGVRTESKDKVAKRKERHFLNSVGDKTTLQHCAEEVANQRNYTGYAGAINGFLQPYCGVGWVANVYDSRYPKLRGDYLVEGVDVTFGVNGARRKVEIGVKLS